MSKADFGSCVSAIAPTRRPPSLPPTGRHVRRSPRCLHAAMEANRDGAETCVVRAEAALREQDFAKALRLLIKAKAFYPLEKT